MVEIVKITPSAIELKGVGFKDGLKVQVIMEICHKFKHLYKDGFPYGRKARKKLNKRFKKWQSCPGICFVYLIKHDEEAEKLAIHILTSDVEKLKKKYSLSEIEYFKQMYTQDVADEIVKTFGSNFD